ncbi:magnesium transporter [Pelistega indica]|uniref:Magnesium and cobalt efflux protein CorC n=1 Tax=Pelistega indica TaxID=1414851 RepID=V8G1Q4_9BURK|nr:MULTISPECIES: transporter associated domain-containing protein [Pelistega]ETD69617.1 magnesium transporter [Pelistega indica]
MSTEPYPSAAPDSDLKTSAKHSLARRLSQKVKGLFSLQHEPEDREDINELLNSAHEKGIIDQDAYDMILGSISFSEKIASDIMVPRSKMDCIDINQPISEIVPFIIETAHSRFPVYEVEKDNIIGLLLAKDLLRYVINPEQSLRSLVRPAYFVPETKALNNLMQEFKTTRNHIAIVIDEYGSLTGLVTMEDLLEQIVGDIEDEYDEDAEQTIFPESANSWRVMGVSSIKHLNETIDANIPEDEYDTIGGWLAAELDHIPKRGDTYEFHHFKFKVLRADEKRAQWIHIRRAQPSPQPQES